jgi:hypothetical protein
MSRFLVFISLFFAVFSTCVAQLSEVSLDRVKNPNEPSVCFDKSNDSIIYAASNIDNFYSLDLRSDRLLKQRSTSSLGVYGDPVLHWSGSDVYFAHLSKTQGKGYGDWFDRIVVQQVSDVSTWEEKSYSVGYNKNKMQDKPWLSSDEHSPLKGSVYVTWTEFDKYDSDNPLDHSRIRFSALRHGADSFSEAITISDTVGDCLDGDHTLEGANTVVDSSGNIYAVWAGHDNIYFDKSTDGGLTWGRDEVIAKQVGGWDMDMPNIMRANGMPFMASDVDRDILYVTWADERNGNADIWLKYSRDQGESWSSAIQLNLDQTDRHQYFPNIAIDPHTGKVYIAYYDFKSSSTNSFYTISLALFNFNGEVWGSAAKRIYGNSNTGVANVQLTPYVIPLPGKKTFYGDYLDIDIYKDKLAVVYTAYDLNQKTEVNLILEETLSDGIFGKIAINNTLAIIRNSDSAQVMLNIEHPHKSKIKLCVVSNGKVQKHVFRESYDGDNRGWDQQIGALRLGKNDEIKKIKYRIRDTEIRNVYKRVVKP